FIMKIFNKSLVAAMAAVTLILLFVLNGCKKDLVPIKTKVSSSPIVNQPTNDQMVLIPGGRMVPASQIHAIPEGHYLMKKNDHFVEMEKSTNRVVKDFGHVNQQTGPVKSNLPGMVNDSRIRIGESEKTNINTPVYSWITYSYWTNPTKSTPISHFGTSFKVPSMPTNTTDGQLIYIYPALVDSTVSEVLQPVLQWGVAGIYGGGNYWTIANWYISGSSFVAVQLPFIQVTPGTTLSAAIDWKTTNPIQPDGSYNYTSCFVGRNDTLKVIEGDTINPGTKNPPTVIPFVNPLTIAVTSLEAYNPARNGQLNSVVDFPPDTSIKMTNISIQRNGSNTTPIGWTVHNNIIGTNFGQNTVIVNNTSPSGEIDIYFHKSKPVISYTTPDVFIKNQAITPLSPTNTGAAATGYSISPALPAGLTINSTTGVISGTPTAASSATNYTVTATSAYNSGTTIVNITVNDVIPFPVSNNSGEGVSITFHRVDNSIANINGNSAAHSGTTTPFNIPPGVYNIIISPSGSPVNCTITLNTGQQIINAPGGTFSNITVGATQTNSMSLH
ncbi:MAG: Ig domain-containing protein, partial [Mucilaginibacter sp.]